MIEELVQRAMLPVHRKLCPHSPDSECYSFSLVLANSKAIEPQWFIGLGRLDCRSVAISNTTQLFGSTESPAELVHVIRQHELTSERIEPLELIYDLFSLNIHFLP